MPIPTIFETFRRGPELWAWALPLVRLVPALILIAGLKYYFGGARNRAEGLLHGKVILVTGGTSGIGGAVVRDLAVRGAQVILLTRQPPADPFVAEYVEDVRAGSGNELVYAEQVDLGSLRSVRAFATRWIDNAPPRRLDAVVLCAGTLTPALAKPARTRDGLEPCWGVNFLANFHLLSILSPAIRAQPPDRAVRVVVANCATYKAGELAGMRDARAPLPKGKELATSKLALVAFARAFQKHLDAFARPDKKPNNARVILVDPGLARTPGTRRWLTMGSLWGLLVYLVLWPVVWLVLKSPEQGAQTVLTALLGDEYGKGEGGRMLRECKEVKCARPEVDDEKVAGQLWAFSEKQITALEKEDALRRAKEKKKTDEPRVVEIVEKEAEGASAAKPDQGKVSKRR